ncbi:MAG: hypothetical protein MUD00_00885 [Candidatus Pacebacteria bacterium]|jgi:hypothetical protein|nr:hypothetical protein [Candidatus Paceibacterota bacterium]
MIKKIIIVILFIIFAIAVVMVKSNQKKNTFVPQTKTDSDAGMRDNGIEVQ